MKNNDKQITGTKECETSYHVFIFKEAVNKELKKNDVKIEANIVSVILFCRETISVFSHIILWFCHIKYISSLLHGVSLLLINFFKF